MTLLNRKVIEKDTAEMVAIRSHEHGRELSSAEKYQCEKDVCKAADRAERRANGER